jgi:hypothetical protein
MSQTLYVDFRGNGFWAFDAISAVFLKHLTDAASQQTERPGHEWLSEAIKRWRVNAVFSCFGLFLDDSWSPEQIATFTSIATEACEALSLRQQIPAEEIESWEMVDGERCFARGLPAISTASAIRLGRAVIELVNGTLPQTGPGTWWFFTTENDPRTIRKRED